MSDESTIKVTELGLPNPAAQAQNDGDAGSDPASTSPPRRSEEIARDGPDTRDGPDAHVSRTNDGATNVVEIVGTVMQQRRSDRGSVARTLISPTRAITTQLALEVHEEDGETYGLQLVFPARVAIEPGLLEALAGGERVQVRGRLSWRDTYDLRYASADHPLGRAARELVVSVLEFARAEPTAVEGSWVRLQGTVLVPPQIRPHETIPGLRVARTSLQVTVRIASTRPGSRAEFIETANIPIDIPLELPTSGAALRASNLVEIEGRLERYRQRIHPERSEPVDAAMTALRARQDRELAVLDDRDHEAARRRGARDVRALLYEDRLRIRAGYVELVAGMPLDDLDEVVANRQAWTEAARTRRTMYQRRQEQAAPQTIPQRRADDHSKETAAHQAKHAASDG